MSHRAGFLGGQLSQRTGVLGLRLWEILAFGVGALTALILFLLLLRLNATLARSKPSKKKQLISTNSINVSIIPTVSKDIKEVVSHTHANTDHMAHEPPLYKLPWSVGGRRHSLSTVEYMLDDIEKEVVTFNFAYGGDTQVHSVRRPKPGLAAVEKVSSVENVTATRAPQSQIRSTLEDDGATVALASTEVPRGICADHRGGSITMMNRCRSSEWSGWGEWYSVEELEKATSQFSESNIVGKGGYGVVYRGLLPDASVVAVKHLLNISREQAEKEFRVEVEAIGRVRHKNLVGLLGYCADGPHRMLVYEYVDNGNLEQRLHGPLAKSKPIPWNVRMNILLGTAKG